MSSGLAENLDRDRALSGDDVRIVEGMHEDQVALARKNQSALEGSVVVISVQDDFGAQVHHRLNLDVDRGLRHHDDGGDSAPLRGERHALRMVTGR